MLKTQEHQDFIVELNLTTLEGLQAIPYNHGPKPGELMHAEMNQVMEERDNSQEASYKDFRQRMGLNR